MCFFTQRNHKYYLKGSRTKNSGHGYWKLASQSEKPIKKANCTIGFIRSLIYYRGNKTKHETKTDWIMYEYRVNTQLNYADKLANSSATPPQSTNKLAEWVLCKVYNKNKMINKVQDAQVMLEKPVVLEAVQDLEPEFPNSFIQDLVKELLTDSDPIALNEDQSEHYLIDNIPVLSGIYGNECIKLQANESSTSSTAYNVPDHLIPAEEINVITSRKSKSSNNEHRDFASEYFKGQFS
ncbi:NAC domain containing protein [Trema orientale]|uniref:NAC domain containing protein n=1 Tax=Trema orientale TaxID=63057 RepID=A0A2P5EVQ9_TREOI|nr:NAC domain containing protein [Trema orientale]